jgi:hypothetical protein
MRSVREIADCIGLKGDFQVVRDFFGYKMGPPGEISLFRQLKVMMHYNINVNIIRVGSDLFTGDDDREIDEAVAFLRDTFASIDLGVGRVRHFGIPVADARGRQHIADEREAEDLTHEWTVSNDAMDVFIVRTFAGSSLGAAPRRGPFNKDARGPMNGVVIAIESSDANTGFALAKYVCRYLGLRPSDNQNNLMYDWIPNGGHLTREQRDDLIEGHFMRFGCGGIVSIRLSGGHL